MSSHRAAQCRLDPIWGSSLISYIPIDTAMAMLWFLSLWNLEQNSTPTPWLTQIHFTQISQIQWYAEILRLSRIFSNSKAKTEIPSLIGILCRVTKSQQKLPIEYCLPSFTKFNCYCLSSLELPSCWDSSRPSNQSQNSLGVSLVWSFEPLSEYPGLPKSLRSHHPEQKVALWVQLSWT